MREFDGTIHVVHFSDERTDATETILDRAREAVAESTLADLPDVELIDLDIRTESGVGKVIVRVAEDGSHGHVEMDLHGSGTVGRAILGSAAETVVRAGSVPITVVP